MPNLKGTVLDLNTNDALMVGIIAASGKSQVFLLPATLVAGNPLSPLRPKP